MIATKALPFLFPLSIENGKYWTLWRTDGLFPSTFCAGLSVKQYSVVMSLIRTMIDRVEVEHRAKLEQLNSLQDEQK